MSGKYINKVEQFLEDTRKCAIDLEGQVENIDKAISILKEARDKKQHVFVIGCGGSSSTATHFASDLFKSGGLRAISLVDNIPLNSALINDEGWSEVFVQQVERLFDPGDIIIAISVHGGIGKDRAESWSQNLLKAIDYVNKNGGKSIGLAGFDGGAMKTFCTTCIIVPAESTPIVESFHVVLHHLITWQLYEGDRK